MDCHVVVYTFSSSRVSYMFRICLLRLRSSAGRHGRVRGFVNVVGSSRKYTGAFAAYKGSFSCAFGSSLWRCRSRSGQVVAFVAFVGLRVACTAGDYCRVSLSRVPGERRYRGLLANAASAVSLSSRMLVKLPRVSGCSYLKLFSVVAVAATWVLMYPIT